MPEDKMTAAMRYAEACDLCIVLGSSLVIYPAASIPAHALDYGAKLIIISRDETPLDTHAQVVIRESLSKALAEVTALKAH
jgi:NAD-dependent deacetylase